MRNIRITDKQDKAIQQAESGFPLLSLCMVLGVLAVWFYKDAHAESPSVEVHKWPVAAVGNKPCVRGIIGLLDVGACQ